METSKKIYIFLIAITVVVVLIYAQSIIIPFVLAILFWFMIRVIKKLLSKIRLIRHWPKWIFTVISSVILLSFLVFTVEMISSNIQDISNTFPVYEKNVNKITQSINQQFDIDLSAMINDYTKNLNFGNLLSKLLSALTGLFGDAFTVLLYLIFILLEEPIFPKKIKAMYPDEKKHRNVNNLIKKIDHSIRNYIALKTLVSLLTGFLSYFVILFIGVDAPLFWAFLIFVLNFIPTIGSLIATIFPAIFAMLHLVEPRVMGNSLNISPLVVFLTLVLWGVLWGVIGMLLSVPITVILIITMSEFPGTRPIAILLSQKGNIKISDAE
jgi:predicted PurR-regulated permease PerM